MDKNVSIVTAKKMNFFISSICILYSILIIILAIKANWPQKYVIMLVVDAGLFCHFMFNGNFGESLKKILGCATIMTTVVICAINGTSMEDVTVLTICFTVVMAVWGEKNLIHISVFAYLLIGVYYLLLKNGIAVVIKDDVCKYLKELFNVLIISYIMYIWNKNRQLATMAQENNIEYLKQLEKSKDDFLANISHEIRTPINTINGMSDIAMNENDMVEVKKKITAIKNAGRNLMSVISDIFDFSELQSNNIEVSEGIYSMTSVLNDVLNMTLPWKGEKDIEVIVNYDVNMPNELVGDEQKVKRILINMVHNAIKFTNKGGVTINISHRNENYGVNLCLEVKDTGIGMSKEFMEELFYTYNALTLSLKASGGVGFGMSIMKVLVEKLGGVITLDSKLGRGTTIKAIIPQRVANRKSSVDIRNYKGMKLLTYIEIQKFKMLDVRDEYTKSIHNMAKQLEIDYYECRTFNDLKRQIEKGGVTHIATATSEYIANRDFFEKISSNIQVLVVIDKKDEKLNNNNLIYLLKPFSIINIANALNDYLENGVIKNGIQKFTGKDVKVLAVDDNAVNIMVLRGLVEKYDIQIDEALSGFEAINMIESKDYDFVFMDHMMPGLDGIQTLKAIRKKDDEYYKKVPIIALTANAVSGKKEMFIKEGFDDFLEKPIDTNALERMLYKYIPKEKLILGQKESTVIREKDIEKHIGVMKENVINEMVDKQLGQKNKEEQLKRAYIKYLDNFDVEKGKMYCGGEENYLMILEKTLPQVADVEKRIQAAYSEQTWEQYTINVHGLKGIMLNLGEKVLSDMALKLEKASRSSDIDFVDMNHNNLMIQTQEVTKKIEDFLKEIKKVDNKEVELTLEKQESNIDLSSLHAIDKDEFNDIINNFESAAYEFDEEKMLSIIEGMKQLSYNGKNLYEELGVLKYKIEMLDYLSAYESLCNVKKKLEAGD